MRLVMATHRHSTFASHQIPEINDKSLTFGLHNQLQFRLDCLQHRRTVDGH